MKAIVETTIAHYRIMEPIGAGGMGAVYKAYDTKLQRVVALKLLPPEYLSQQDRRRRFFQEARAASALNHPHILTVYEVGEDDGKPYIAMEYVEGETLRHKIKARSLELKDTLDIAIQIAEGLGKAHEVGIIHRDLKPENLMISRDGYAKILDFGLAKLVAQRERALAAIANRRRCSGSRPNRELCSELSITCPRNSYWASASTGAVTSSLLVLSSANC
jgi:serine/threonine protein kinase